MGLNKVLEGISERSEHILLFEPLCKLMNKKVKEFPEVGVFEVSIATLVFFLDEMLRGNKITARSIEQFLKNMLAEKYNLHLTNEEVRKLRIYIVDVELRNEGRDFSYEKYDVEKMKMDKISFKYITREIRGNESYLKLTDKGVELLFKTREIFSEGRINFTILYFKQQLEKQNFASSLELARSLNFEIQNEIDRLEDDIKRIKTNVISAIGADGSLNKARNEKMLVTMKEVQAQFESLFKVVDSVRENYPPGISLSKEVQDKVEKIEQINNLIVQSQSKTDIWMTKWLEMTVAIDDSFESILINLSNKRLDFESEVLNRFMEKEIDSVKLKKILMPTYPINLKKIYNPMRGFLPMKIRKEREIHSEEIEKPSEEQINEHRLEEERKQKMQFEQYVRFSEVLVKPLLEKDCYSVEEIFDRCATEKPEVYSEIMEDEENYKKFMFLCGSFFYSKGPVRFIADNTQEINEMFDIGAIIGCVTAKLPDLEMKESFEIRSTDEKLELQNGYEITNFIVTKGEE